MSDSWKRDDEWKTNIDSLTNSLIDRNKNLFGNIFKRKHELHRRLRGIDKKLKVVPNKVLSLLQNDLWKELEDFLF